MKQERVEPEDLEQATSHVCDALQQATGEDWSVRAGSVRWSCLRTAGHIADCLLAYAGQIVTGYEHGWLPFRTRLAHDITPAGALDFVKGSARILATSAQEADAVMVAYHPFGPTDAEGFLAMGCGEVLIHGYDIATGLGAQLDPPRELCRKLNRRLLSHSLPADEDQWQALLRATNRLPTVEGALSNRRWHWHSSPASTPT